MKRFFTFSRESNFHSFISLLTIVTMALTVIGVFPKPNVQANTYDVVIEATIGQEDYKVLEINNTTGDVSFYEFTVDGDPVLDGNNDQTTFVPGDNDFEDRLIYLNDVIIFSSLTIASSSEFALPIFVGDGYYGDTITQVCYDGDSSTDYRVIQHNELDAPFIPASLIGTFAYMEVGETTYTGFRYTPNSPLGQWDQAAINGSNSGSTSATTGNDGIARPVRFTIIGTTSSGKVVKIEDKGDGSGPHGYVWEDDNGDGIIQDDEWKEVKNDPDGDPPTYELDELMEEVANDIENGLGFYTGEAYDANNEKVDLVLYYKTHSGSYVGIRMDYSSSSDSWVLDAKSSISNECMVYLGYIPAEQDYNPDGAWSVGSRPGGSIPEAGYGFQNYARFDDDGNKDPYGTQTQYWYGGASNTTPDPVPNPGSGNIVAFPVLTHGAWPADPCPPL